jgi:hypothetical protein
MINNRIQIQIFNNLNFFNNIKNRLLGIGYEEEYVDLILSDISMIDLYMNMSRLLIYQKLDIKYE